MIAKIPMTAVTDVCTSTEPSRIERPKRIPTYTSRIRAVRRGARPRIAAGRMPTAHARPRVGSPVRTISAAGSVHTPQRSASDHVQVSAAGGGGASAAAGTPSGERWVVSGGC
jgi:hypothetical protein